MTIETEGSILYRPFTQIREATFISRMNRFLIECRLGGRLIRAFLPNPGRLQELLLPGVPLYIVKEDGVEGRATSHTAVAVLREGYPIMLHTHKTNQVVGRFLEEGLIPGLEGSSIVRPEVRVGHSRFDFLLNDGAGDIFLEVKSCTLVGKQIAMFPDAVTARGARHLEELAGLSGRGIRTAVVFVIHWPLASVFMPDYHTDLHFARTLLAARESVKIIPLSVEWLPDLSLSRRTRLLDVPWPYIEREAHDRGSYLFILKLPDDMRLEVGKLGQVFFRKGFYIYVGSAMANLTKRIERHRRLRKGMHWHIDYLRPHAAVRAALPIRSSDRLECPIARSIREISEWAIKGFGCSDCSCDSHLFAMAEDPLQSPQFQKILQHFRMDRYQPAV
jgi:sugar fermentation stimulation protein A